MTLVTVPRDHGHRGDIMKKKIYKILLCVLVFSAFFSLGWIGTGSFIDGNGNVTRAVNFQQAVTCSSTFYSNTGVGIPAGQMYQRGGANLDADDVLAIPTTAIDTDTNLAADSDDKVASQKATKAYVDANVGGSISILSATLSGDITGNVKNVWHTTVFDTVERDTYSALNTSTGVWTAPKNMTITVTVGAAFAITANDLVYLVAQTNGSSFVVATNFETALTTPRMSCSKTITVSTNDTVSIATLNGDNTYTVSTHYATYFQITEN